MLPIADGSRAFWIDIVEVTAAEYQRCVEAGACTSAKTGGRCNAGHSERSDDPANCVDHTQAQAFCAWTGRRLPTAWEWQKAACAPGREQNRSGDAPEEAAVDCFGRHAAWSRVGRLRITAQAKGTCAVRAHPQGAAPSGMFGVGGNVAEWTATARDGHFVSVGGNWAEARGAAGGCRSELGLHPGYRDELTGFRCARSEPRTLRADLEDAFF